MEWPDPISAGVVVSIAAIGSVIQGSIGFGFAVFAAPLVTLIDARIVPGPMLFGAFVLTLLLALREREAIDLTGIKWALVGRIPGVALGVAVLAVTSPRALVVLLGALVVVATLMTARGPTLLPSPRTLLFAGLLSGFMGTAASIGGPPIALVYQAERGPKLRGTLSGYFLVGTVMSLAALLLVGRFGNAELAWSVVLVPGVVAGFACSAPAARWLDAKRRGVQTALLIFSAVSGVVVIARQLLFA
jgi:uncharacterized membrane protein YfcA